MPPAQRGVGGAFGTPQPPPSAPPPPGFQPIQGAETPAGEQSVARVLEAAMKLASQEDHEEEDAAEEAKVRGFFLGLGTPCPPHPETGCGERSGGDARAQGVDVSRSPRDAIPLCPSLPPALPRREPPNTPRRLPEPPPPPTPPESPNRPPKPPRKVPSGTTAASARGLGCGEPPGTPIPPLSLPAAQQQLAFLEGRRKQLMHAALRAKQSNDMEGAKLFLRQAKGLDPMIEASHNGLPVDITKVGAGFF